MNLLFYIPLGLLPSFVWLFYYLKKDLHPEPKLLITEVFILGMISTFLALPIQYFFISAESLIALIGYGGFIFWLILAFIEEFVKFLFVSVRMRREKEFDESVDAMVYMTAVGLGFAALENILYLNQFFPYELPAAFGLLAFRFIGATLIHALSSAFLGYFWALSFLTRSFAKPLILFGFLGATLLHTVFNYSIVKEEIFLTALLLIFSAAIIGLMFKRLSATNYE